MGTSVRVLPGAYKSFSAFYAEHFSTAVGFLRKAGAHERDIPDIAQQVFLKIYQDWEKPPIDGIGMSLETLCKQKAAEHYRLHRNRFERPEPNVGVEMASQEDNAQGQLERHELDQIVQCVLATMDPQLRDVLIRCEFGEEPIDTIAKSSKVARNTVYARLAEAKKIFRARARRMLSSDKLNALLLLPLTGETMPVHEAYQRVWQGLALELGYGEHDPPALRVHREESAVPQSGARRIHAELPTSLKRWIPMLVKPVILLGAGALAGIAGTLWWPRDTPSIARHSPSMLGDVIVERGTTEANVTPAASVASMPSASKQFSNATTAPLSGTARPDSARELWGLDRARGLIAQGQYADALAVLRQHDREFAHSAQATARKRYIALAQAGQDRTNETAPKSP